MSTGLSETAQCVYSGHPRLCIIDVSSLAFFYFTSKGNISYLSQCLWKTLFLFNHLLYSRHGKGNRESFLVKFDLQFIYHGID